jgi:hypothetical protein
MSEEINLDSATLLSHSQWLASSSQSAVEGIMNRAGVLLGAIGVELSILPSVHGSGIIRTFAAAVLAFAAVFSIFAMRPMKRRFPATEDLREVYRQQRRADLTALVHLFGIEQPELALIPQLQQEAKKRGDWYRLATCTFFIAQVFIVIMIGVTQNG